MRRSTLSYLAGAGALAALSWPLIGIAQGIPEADGGARAEAGITLNIELDDGDPEFRTGFDLDLITATRTQRLTFSGNFGFVVPLDDFEAAALNDPRYGVDYLRDNGRTRLTFSANYSSSDLESLRRLEDDPGTGFDESTLTLSEDGSRDQIAAQVALEVGLTDPIGAELRYRFNDVSYIDVTDPDLVESTVNEVVGAMRFDVDPTLRFGIDGQWRLTESGGPAPQEELRTRIGSSVTWQARPDLDLHATLAHVAITTDTTIGAITTRAENDGINMTLGADLDRPNGSYSFDISHLLYATGFVDRAEFGRSLELPGGAQVSFSLGATSLPSGANGAVGALSYARETGRGGDLDVSLNWNATLNDDDIEVRRTVLAASYSEELPRGARWSLSGQLTDSTFLTGTDPDIASARISLSYRRPLTEDWSLATGTSWQMTEEEGSPETTSNRLFLSLERRFTLRR